MVRTYTVHTRLATLARPSIAILNLRSTSLSQRLSYTTPQHDKLNVEFRGQFSHRNGLATSLQIDAVMFSRLQPVLVQFPQLSINST